MKAKITNLICIFVGLLLIAVLAACGNNPQEGRAPTVEPGHTVSKIGVGNFDWMLMINSSSCSALANELEKANVRGSMDDMRYIIGKRKEKGCIK